MSSLIYKRIPPPLQFWSRQWGPTETTHEKLACWKAFTKLVSEIIRISIFYLIWGVSNSNLFLRQWIFKMSYYQFIQILNPQRFLNPLSTWFLASGIYSSFNKGIETTLFSSFCQLKMLDKTLVKVFSNIVLPLLFRCSLLPCKCCNSKVFDG